MLSDKELKNAERARKARLTRLTNKLKQQYELAAYAAQKRLEALMESHEKELEKWQEDVQSGKHTKEDFEQWKLGKAAQLNWYKDSVNAITQELMSAGQRAREYIEGALPEAFVDGANRAVFEAETGAGIATTYQLVDVDTVAVLTDKNPLLLPKPSARANIPKAELWDKRRVTSSITQSILLGESTKDAAKRLQGVVGGDFKAAVRNARTALTGAENAGRVHGYKRAKELGIHLKQEWLAALDDRTRSSHRHLDGERVEVGEKFSNGCRFPGDPEARPAEIYNCRCTLVAAIDELDQSNAERNTRKMTMSYEEWKAGKSEQYKTNALFNTRSMSGNLSRSWFSQFEPETAVIKTANGKIFNLTGTPEGIEIPKHMHGKMKDAEYSHTHTTTIGDTFSSEDIHALVGLDMARMEAVSTLTGEKFSLVRVGGKSKIKRGKFAPKVFEIENMLADDEQFKEWKENYEPLGIPLDTEGSAKALRKAKERLSDWFVENAHLYGYKYVAE